MNALSRHGHRLLQVGMALFLFTSLEGFAIPYSLYRTLDSRYIHLVLWRAFFF
jgi:hypothetical protein